MLSSSAGLALAELSQAVDLQHEELLRNIQFNAKGLVESETMERMPNRALSAPEVLATAASKEASPGGTPGSYSEMVYGRLSELHNDEEAHRAMFTEDAWEGMNIVREYGRFIESKEDEENACEECVQNRKLVERAWQVVSNEFYDPVRGFSQANWAQALYSNMVRAGGLLRTKAQTYAVLTDMVASLGDRYSAFLPPSLYRLAIRHPNPSEVRYLAAQYTGIGIELGPPSPLGGYTIVAPFASSPAEEAGIRPGERLLAIDGLPSEQLTRDEAVTLMRGPVGSQVQLDVVSTAGQERQVAIERRTLPRPPTKHFNVSGPSGQLFSYIRMHYFSSDGTRMVQAAIKEGEALGVDGYILDLRNNPGGVFEEAVACAALWLDCGSCQVVTTVNTNAGDDVIYEADNLSKNIFPAHPGNLTRAPLVVLANRGSASASEVLAGALRDNARAVYVGERSFGKGVIQYYFPMTDGSGLKLTVAKYLTPNKYDIAASGGLVPDLECHDYPHGRATDDCIQLAMRVMSKDANERRKLVQPTPDQREIPYAKAGVKGTGPFV